MKHRLHTSLRPPSHFHVRGPWIQAALVLAMVVFAACTPRTDETASDAPMVVVSTTMLGDLVTQLAGDDLRVVTIMQPGADPHLYRPTPTVARDIARSDAVVISGLHLEGWAQDLVENAGGERPLIVASDGLSAITAESFAGGVDPHFWFDVRLWLEASETVAAGLVTVVDADAAERIRARQRAYAARTQALHDWVSVAITSIPESSRVLVTSHDAFNYFGRAYGLEVVGIQGLSTESEASQRDVANAIDRVRADNIPAVFAETSVNPALIERVGSETSAVIAGPLYSDSIGPADGPAGTYDGMIRENVRMIVTALGGTLPPSPE